MTARPDEIHLCNGRLRLALGLFILVSALVAILLSGLGPVTSAAALMLLAAIALRFRRHGRRPDVRLLVFHPDQTMAIDGDRGRVHSDFVIGPAVGLRLELGPGRQRRCVLFRDEMEPDAWRRLRARLRHP